MSEYEALIQELIRLGYLQNPRLLRAFREVDRAFFVPPELATVAYANRPLPIGLGQTISQPLTVAFMLELLDVQPGERVLEIGAGSGWQTGLLAHLVGAEGRVIAMELLSEMCGIAEWNLRKISGMTRETVRVILGDGSQGAPELHVPEGGFDKIIVAASAARAMPEVWLRQLRTGGRIVAPVGNSIYAIEKRSPKRVQSSEYPGFAFVPLVEAADVKMA